MSLFDQWKEVVKINGFDKFAADDQAIMKKVFFSGAVACYALMLSGSEDARLSLQADLKEFTDQHRNLQVPTTD